MNGDTGTLERYLTELRAELKARGVDDAGDLPEEIRSHVRDATGEGGSDAEVGSALEAFGTPARLAASVASERVAGVIEAGPQPAPPAHRLVARFLDAVWIAGVPLVLGGASSWGWRWIADLLLGASGGAPQPLSALFVGPDAMITAALTIGALAWLILALRRTVRALRERRSTVGMRAAGLTFAETPGGRMVVRASDALAFGVAPVTRRGWAVAGVGLSSLLVTLAIAFVAASGLFASLPGPGSTSETDAAMDYCRDMVGFAYGGALSGDPDAAAGMRELFASAGTSFDEFAGQTQADGVKAYTNGGYGYRLDYGVASIEVETREWVDAKAASPASRQAFFTFRRSSEDPDSEWKLVKVVRDPLGRAGGSGPSADEARALITTVLGEAGVSGADRATTGTERMTDSFAASEEAKPLLRGDRPGPTFDRIWSIDSIELSDRFAFVATTEWWLPEGARSGTAPERRFVYRVLLSRGTPLVDGRELLE
jgi:hypothetical protein